jgi:hypothetical protein
MGMEDVGRRRTPKPRKPKSANRPTALAPERLGISVPGSAGADQKLAVRGPRSAALIDLTSILNDLLIAGMAASYAAGEHLNAPALVFAREACFEGAIVAYGRCFVGGQGTGGRRPRVLDGFIAELDSELREAHEYLLHLRDKRISHHIAGSVGQTGDVYFDVLSLTETAVHLSDVHVTVDSEYADQELMNKLEKLSQVLRGRLGSHIDELRAELRDLAKGHAKEMLEAIHSDRPWQAQ